MQGMKWLVEKHYKDEFHRAAKRSKAAGNSNEVYTFEMLRALRDMAERDIYPDGSFGDNDCLIWSMYRNMAAKKVV